MVGWRLLGVRRDFWDCVFAWCVILFTAATSLVAQVSVTSERAKETAQALTGKKVDKAEVYSSQDGRAEYLAFAAYIDLEKRGGSQDLWLYKRAGETFEKVWHGEFQSPDFGFVTLPGETLPSLRIYEMACGSGGCVTTLSL